ncbi:MAG TPA: hypothetical protein VF668_19735 [Pyrinomonadaceae bacterium]|jgi:hypothetical protein
MSATVKKPSGNVSDFGDENAFRRRRNHAQIEAMTGLILQAVGYPTRRHRDFICALQSTNSGDAARVPHTPFRRAHLTLAELMTCEGSPETKRKAVYREIVTLRTFQRRKGLILFKVTSGNEEEATEYVDYLTPAADAAVQRALSSPLWQTDKQAAKREAVAWAVEQLPRCEVEEEAEGEGEEPALAEYQEHVKKRILSELERAALKIEERGGDAELWACQVLKEALKGLESRAKTAPARLDHSALRAVKDDDEGTGGDTSAAGGNTTGDGSVRPPSPAWPHPPTSSRPRPSRRGRTVLSAPLSKARMIPRPSRSTRLLFSQRSAPLPPRSLRRRWRPRSRTPGGAGPSSRCTTRTLTAAAPASTRKPVGARASTRAPGRG